MAKTISILLADDHALLRGVLAQSLNREPDMEVVGTVGNAEDAVEEAAKSCPRIVLLDIDMAGLSSFEAAREIQERSPDARVIFLSAFYHDRYIEQALAVRAWGYVVKNEPEDTLIAAIRKVVSGIAYFSPEVQTRLVIDGGAPRLGPEAQSRASTLSPREIEILRYIARGTSQKEIAQILHISTNTVHRHTSSLMDKLDIHDRVQLSRYAIREGLAEG